MEKYEYLSQKYPFYTFLHGALTVVNILNIIVVQQFGFTKEDPDQTSRKV